MANLELLPCPFCGEQPKVLRSTHEIVCGGQDCFGPVTTAGNLEDASVQWNKRAPPEPTEGLRIQEIMERHAPDGFDPASDDMTIPFAIKIGELEEQLTALRAMPLQEDGWQRISTAPKNSKDLLLCVAGFSPLTGHWNESTRCWVSHPDHTSYEPTHWMPIRAVPAMVAEGGAKS